jgi:5'-3' exonuclease
MVITLKPSKGPILLVDMSYYVFYRYYATFNWYKRQTNVDIDVAHIRDNVEFMEKYAKMFEKTLVDLMKSHKITNPSNVVFAKDCSRDNIWRHRYYDAYKATREEKSASFNKDVFTYTYHTLIPSLQEKHGFQIIGHYCLEADDVIAIITKNIFDTYLDGNIQIIIITNDNDYIQLMNIDRLCNIEEKNILNIRNLQDKNICDRVNCSSQVYTNVKKILGDKSDNIPAITRKCGEKTAYKLATNLELLETLLDKEPEAKKQYELNDLLIDFKNIPDEYCCDIKNKVCIM